MNSRSRLIITALLTCHLFLLPAVLTSQLRPETPEPAPEQEQGAMQTASPPSPANSPSTTESAQPAGQQSTSPAPPAQPDATTQTPSAQENLQDRTADEIIQKEVQATEEAEKAFGTPPPGSDVVLARDEVLIHGDNQEKNQDIYKVRGHVVIRFRNYTLHSDEATYDSTTGQVTATGHVVFDGGTHNEHLVGTHATYDVTRDTGVFYDVVGSSGVRVKNKMIFLISSTPFFFTGKVVDKLGPDEYRVHHGYVTSCMLPKPKWQFNAQTANIELGDEARMYHATLRIRDIPIFYFPYVEHPVDNLGRKTGFLIPVIGQSNSRGTIIGEGFFWAINRSSDLNIGTEYFTSRGPSLHLGYRSLGFKYQFHSEFYGVDDIYGYPATGQKQGGEEWKANGNIDLPWHFRGALSVDLLSSYLFRLAFGQSFTEAVNSEVRSSGFVSKNWNGYALGALVSRYQNYQSANNGDYIAINHTPSLEFSSVERPLYDDSRFMYSYDVAGEGLSRTEPGFHTPGFVGRLDVAPFISMPTFLNGWTFRPELGARETLYADRLLPATGVPVGVTAGNPINRNVLNASVEVRPPSVSKIFEHKPFGYVYKNTIEPSVIYRYQSGIENFAEFIRFDQRDILADTNEVRYGVITRLYAKKTKSPADCFNHPKYLPLDQAADPVKAKAAFDAGEVCDDSSGPAKEVVSLELAQKYYMNTTFGGALVPGSRNVFDDTVDLTGIAFLNEPRRFSPIVSRLKAQYGTVDFQWALDYDTVLHQVNASTIFAGYGWHNWGVGGGQTYLNAPGEVIPGPNGTMVPDIFNQYRMMLLYGNLSRVGPNAAFTVGWDAKNKYIQYTAMQVTYNWDCCGVTFEYRRWALGLVRNENFYKFALTLANFGTFGNLRRQDRLY